MKTCNPCDPIDERAAAGIEEETLPCDVAVAPGLIIGAGCSMSVLLAQIRGRRGMKAPLHFKPAVLRRVLPANMLSDVSGRIAHDIGLLVELNVDIFPHEKVAALIRQRLEDEQASATLLEGSLLARLEASSDPLCHEAAAEFRNLAKRFSALGKAIDEMAAEHERMRPANFPATFEELPAFLKSLLTPPG